MRGFITCTLLKVLVYTQNDQVKEDKMGRVCSMNGREEKCIKDMGGKARRKETTRKTKMYVGG
jgi:hypothetical protein